MLHDRARIHIQAGAGGDGAVSFRREAHVPRGGPDGGDGGRGGDVFAVCDGSLRDLQSYRRRARYAAGRGGNGSGALRHGADGETLHLPVPPGTRIEADDDEEGSLTGRSWELMTSGASVLLARGGSGGAGNKRFATATRQSPRFAERGLPGEEGWLSLQLRLLADVGLVGLPNAGKSSLLARLTRAAPKIADYPFTTLSPVLGVLESDDRQLVIADIPGLIEGASGGAGLGHEFLAHIERTRLLVHVLDIAPELSQGQGADLAANHATIERELAAHDPRLAELPRVLVLSKSDLVDEATIADKRGRVARAARPRRARARLLECDGSGPARAGRGAAGPRPRRARTRPGGLGRSNRRPTPRPPASRNWPSTCCSAPAPARGSRWSGCRTTLSPSVAGESNGCSNDSTSTTRRRWPTSRSGCATSA